MMIRIIFAGMVLAAITFTGCYFPGPCLNGSGPLTSEMRDIDNFTGVTNTGSFDVFVTEADVFSVEVIAQENLLPIIETYVSGYTLIVRTENSACYKSSQPVEVHISMPETELLRLSGSGRVFADNISSAEVEIANSGSGHMEIDTVWADAYVVSNSGSGDVAVEGAYTEEIEVIQSGSGAILCGILYGVAEIDIRHSSSGRVSATILDGEVIDASLSGSGRILLEGDIVLADYVLNSSGRLDALELEAYDVKATNTGSGKVYVWANDLLDVTITGSGDIIYRGNPDLTTRITGSGRLISY